MKHAIGVFNTDQVNRQNIYVPVTALAGSIADHIKACVRRKIPLGMPSHIGHDMHRFVGWSYTTDIHLTGHISRQLGSTVTPETDEEKNYLEFLRVTYWRHHHEDHTAKYKGELIQRVSPAETSNAQFVFIGAAAIKEAGLASSLYPELFSTNSALVDKDGLTDYREILSRLIEIQPGVFHDRNRDLLLFAHRFFRRSLSHANNLNAYFLKKYTSFVQTYTQISARLRLDPDLLGHPSSVRQPIELEYWHGPHFQDDIEKIPSGVAEHKASEDLRHFEGVDKTQLWWKDPETRIQDKITKKIRTFEAEELIQNPSEGLEEEGYGCRYTHAEYDIATASISHFDGAIRAYGGEAYLDRFELSIDRAGKHSNYTKLFRLDGKIPVADWKTLVSDFFRGNDLIPEYLNHIKAPTEAKIEESSKKPLSEPKLTALVRIGPPQTLPGIALVADRNQLIAEEIIPYVELGAGQVAACLQRHIDLAKICTVAFSDKILNLSPLVFGRAETLDADWKEVLGEIADAVEKDIDGGLIEHMSFPVIWVFDGLSFTLSLAGEAACVAQGLREVAGSILPSSPITKWIAKLSVIIKRHNDPDTEPAHRNTAFSADGYLIFSRPSEIEVSIKFPQELLQRIAPANLAGPANL